LGRAWHSPPEGNLYLSALLRLDPLPPLTLAAGLALQQVLNDLGCRASIKWPNDLLVDGKKVAGILTETSTRGDRMDAIALGIGLNVNGEPPPALAPRATSLRLALGRSLELADVAAQVCARLEAWIDRAVAEGAPAVVEAFRRDSGMIGRRVEVAAHGRPRAGIARDIAADGALLVEDADGLMFRVVSGEVEQLP
jgi:BirA family biotin operon repressor/biotin-[acetyl-CoA-carboxylase] ligase